ncbi:MAG: NAD-dependent epimerase/dehydratase family protein [Chloroflexi bacterium]|nr:NAD-dependent epimerase/dehydratase family protein [Chloroflexota bacterium]
MSEERFLITGAMGCIGAWVVKNLVQEKVPTTVFDLSTNKQRLELIMEAEEVAQVSFIHDDITKTDSVKKAVLDNGITHIIHLAALQVPFCKANPPLGAAVNVVGTVNVFEAAKAAGIQQVVYASSVAVYGRQDEYPYDLLPHDAPLHPHTHYGVFKQANEGTARIYWQDDGIASVGLRPYTLYGPGRDQGMTSTPTKAMLAAARGERYHISFGGYNGFQYTDDVAKIFIQAARTPFSGADVFNIKGTVAHMGEVVAAIEAAEPAATDNITYEATELVLPMGQEDNELQHLLGNIPETPLADGVAQTIIHFKQALADGRLPETGKE